MKKELTAKFGHIFNVIHTEGFLKMEALGGEIPFWIAPFDPSLASETNVEISLLEKKLKAEGLSPLLIDLFELACDIVDEKIGMTKMFDIERKKSESRFRSALSATVNIHERLIPRISEMVDRSEPDVLMIKGVGAVYPFIRSHNVLNNLQSKVTKCPTVLFFPGEYTGRDLNLFGLLKDDNYYRAFNIDDFKL